MNLQELTQKMDDFVATQGWYDKNSKRPQTLRNLAISLILEASEVLELFQWQDTLVDKSALGEELADVFLYLLQIAKVADINLEQVTLAKLNKNYHRTW